MSPARPLFVLIHGAWASSWVWDPIVPRLAEAGYESLAVALPDSRGREEDAGLPAQARAVLAAVGEDDRPLILVGHSGGGIVVSEVGELVAEHVAGVVYVAGLMLPSGVDFDVLRAELGGSDELLGAAPFVESVRDGRASVVPTDAAVALFFHRAALAAAVAAARRLQPQWNRGLDICPTWSEDRLGRIPRLYLETLDDRDVPLAVQRHMQRRVPGARVASLDADHAPQLSAPDELVRMLLAFVAEVSPPAREGAG